MLIVHFTTGRVLADSSLFISCAMSLAVFDITKYSKDGVVVEPVFEQRTGTIRWGFESIGQDPDLNADCFYFILFKSS
jgi:hypothetical protein